MIRIPAASLAFLLLSSWCQAGIVFGPVRAQAGQSVRLVTRSESVGGKIEQVIDGRTKTGTISITRDRDLLWTFRDPLPDGTRRGMVRVDKLVTTTETDLDGERDKQTDSSLLTGKQFAMSKSPAGVWDFQLDGTLPYSKIRHQIEELEVYLKRDWYPTREVNVGDSWEFDPAWIKLIIEKDLHHAQTVGTMRLRQVRKTAQRNIAIIDVSIRSTGTERKQDGSKQEASVDLSGQVTVNLDTMLDESLELSGNVTSTVSSFAVAKLVVLPMKLIATKSFVRDTAFPHP